MEIYTYRPYENEVRTKLFSFSDLDESTFEAIKNRIHLDAVNHLESIKDIYKY